MKIENKDISKIIPYGEFIRGFANQKYLTQPELARILKRRGIFINNNGKNFTVPILQCLLLSPTEFDEIRDSFTTREDNKKYSSSEVVWNEEVDFGNQDLLEVDNKKVNDFIEKHLPTCKLKQPIQGFLVDGNPQHLKFECEFIRNDLNKSWYERENEFYCSVEYKVEDTGEGTEKIITTSEESQKIGSFLANLKYNDFIEKKLITSSDDIRKIYYNDFDNETRIAFLFRLSNKINTSTIFKYKDLIDVSLSPSGEEKSEFPEQIEWMKNIRKLFMTGSKLETSFFIEKKEFHKFIILWKIEVEYEYNYNGETGKCIFSFGFPQYGSKQNKKSEFELELISLDNERDLNFHQKNLLKGKLSDEMVNLKNKVYSNFLNYLNPSK